MLIVQVSNFVNLKLSPSCPGILKNVSITFLRIVYQYVNCVALFNDIVLTARFI